MARVVVSADQRRTSVHHSGGWLEQVWDRGLELTEVVGQQECLDLAPIYAMKIGAAGV